ncbi:HAD family hydrolase [Stieleria sp. ICT_E10.1]|uniref:HAD family hydrolase n=1 Tax=Stieleria sedimenti TaxID=2976331 RepID=UPI00217FBBCC|nr:HAD family hydrolase [Stieleria sedimenti]MCS7471709.1 HAD family hydrolase [Stieleria sedimenti]
MPITPMNAYDWILFDSTGTLLTPDPEPARAYHAAAVALGSEHSFEAVRQNLKAAMKRHFFGDTVDQPTDEAAERRRWRRIVADTIGDLPPDLPPGDLDGLAGDGVFGSLWNHFAAADAWRLYEDALPAIERLKSKGYAIAVASNFDLRLRTILEGMGITHYFDAVLISSELGWSKPNTRFYDAAVSRIGITDRSRLLMIGDTKRGDVDAARQAGLDARLLVRDRPDALLRLTNDL